MSGHYVVVHEYPYANGGTGHGAASGLHGTYESAENALAYCEAMQEEGRRGSEGRYYIARVTEIEEQA